MSMMEFLIYDLKVAGCIAVFYMFYRLLLSRETIHRMNRVVLLATAVASFVLPLCVVTIHHTIVVPQVAGNVSAELPMMEIMDSSDSSLMLWQQAAVAVFFAGIAVTLGKMLWSIGQVIRLIHRSEKHLQSDGIYVVVTDRDVSPFSWMRYVVLNRQDYESLDSAIMAHERGHIRQRHSLDVLLVDSLTVLQWFNPAMWMLRQDLRAIHEYEADAAVLSQGINMRQYQYLLIQKAVSHCGYSVANGISHSTLKNRINMMLTNKKSTRMSWLKLLALLPIVGLTLALNAETVNDYVYENAPQQPQKKVVKKDENVKVVKKAPKMEDPLDKVEVMPEFPGGMPELWKFLQETVKYPEEAKKDGKQGRVVVQFIVEKDGSITEAKVVKNVCEELDAEALRVVNAMPKWTPGKQKGQPVRVKFTLPITFRLS